MGRQHQDPHPRGRVREGPLPRPHHPVSADGGGGSPGPVNTLLNWKPHTLTLDVNITRIKNFLSSLFLSHKSLVLSGLIVTRYLQHLFLDLGSNPYFSLFLLYFLVVS